MLDQTRIVLINTSHPGNIGSAARAMKTMGLKNLYLVVPKEFPHSKALEMASGASDVLAHAKVVQTLDEAISDCELVIGTSARSRSLPWPLFTPKEMTDKIAQKQPITKMAILFGREQSGLTNQELQRCHWHIQIPTDQAYQSLNLAQAVQIISYELKLAAAQPEIKVKWDQRFASDEEMEGFFTHLQSLLIDLQFLKEKAPRKLMARIRRLLYRAHPDVMEINLLRGMLKSVQNLIKQARFQDE